MLNTFDVIVIGAGAAGLMCGIEAGARGRTVLLLDKSNKPGKKILMSGGGRCNFTNRYSSPEQYVSRNPHFCKSALSRYTQWDFIQLVETHKVSYYEKTLGQLFCEHKSSQILELLLQKSQESQVDLRLNQLISSIQKDAGGFIVVSNGATYRCESLVVACGGLSIPTLGSSPFGYQIAAQFGIAVHPTRAGLVPFTWHVEDKARFECLAGISVDSLVSCQGMSFRESLLFTHRGLSGPAILQISSYWRPGDEVLISLLPEMDLHLELQHVQKTSGDLMLKTALAKWVAKRLLGVFFTTELLDKPLKRFHSQQLKEVAQTLQAWSVKPNGTEGYRTAEVTLGGVDCDAISSRTFEAKKVSGLYFVGEVLDVSGWLGGYNFQWAWSSGWAAGQVV